MDTLEETENLLLSDLFIKAALQMILILLRVYFKLPLPDEGKVVKAGYVGEGGYSLKEQMSITH